MAFVSLYVSLLPRLETTIIHTSSDYLIFRFFKMASHPLHWAPSSTDRKRWVRDRSCSRRWRCLIRLPASPVAPDGATAGRMVMISHSQTGLTHPTASVMTVLFLISVSWPLPAFAVSDGLFPAAAVAASKCSLIHRGRQLSKFWRIAINYQYK